MIGWIANEATPLVVALLGGAIGYLLGFVQRQAEEKIRLQIKKREEYEKLLEKMFVFFLAQSDDMKRDEFLSDTVSCLLYASNAVIEQYVAFHSNYAELVKLGRGDKIKQALAEIIYEMRRDCGYEPSLSKDLMAKVIPLPDEVSVKVRSS